MYRRVCVLLLSLHCLQYCFCDWVSEWMTPIKDQLQEETSRRLNEGEDFRPLDDETFKMVPVHPSNTFDTEPFDAPKEDTVFRVSKDEMPIKEKIETTLETATALADSLKEKIADLENREKTLKEAIVNGRSGVSTVQVKTMNFPPRSYIVRDGFWTLCNGVVQTPIASVAANLFQDLFATPKCIGGEVSAKRDPCAFNSLIKYDVIPEERKEEYQEEDVLCIKPNFNSSMEHYMSVPRRVVNETCKNGKVRTLEENTADCGVRTLSEYTFYPHRASAAAALPLEYCNEKDGSCKLLVAWHVSNKTIENFEYLKSDPKFQRYFIKTQPFVEYVI